MKPTKEARVIADKIGFMSFSHKILLNMFQMICWPILIEYVGRTLQRARQEAKTIEELVDLAFSFKCLGVEITPGQIKEEVSTFLRLVADTSPTTVLEIGTAGGGSFFLLAAIASPRAILTSINLPGNPLKGGYPLWRVPLYKSFAKENQSIRLIRADSHSLASVERVGHDPGSLPIDLLFIDGDHSYSGVKKDFEMYSPLVRKNGIVAFHDIVDGPEELVGGVPKFWQEVKKGRRYVEVVKDWEQGGLGIGLLYV